VVVVPPDGVKTCETSGEVWTSRVTDSSHETGVEVNDETETDETVYPDSVMLGVDEAGAGV